MKNKLTDRNFEDISALIREEEEEGLAVFRTRDFRGTLESRLEEAANGRWAHPYRRTWAMPALAGILIFIVAGIVFLILRQPEPVPPPELKALAHALGQLPGFSHTPRREWTGPSGRAETSGLAASVQQVLISAGQVKRGEEQRLRTTDGAGKIPRLSIDQKMEILFKERAIERALLLHKINSREV